MAADLARILESVMAGLRATAKPQGAGQVIAASVTPLPSNAELTDILRGPLDLTTLTKNVTFADASPEPDPLDLTRKVTSVINATSGLISQFKGTLPLLDKISVPVSVKVEWTVVNHAGKPETDFAVIDGDPVLEKGVVKPERIGGTNILLAFKPKLFAATRDPAPEPTLRYLVPRVTLVARDPLKVMPPSQPRGTVRAVVSANVNVAEAPSTLEDLNPDADDIFLLQGQTRGIDNGPWVWKGSGVAMTRPTNWDTPEEAVVGSSWIVEEGKYADHIALLTNETFTLGTTEAKFAYVDQNVRVHKKLPRIPVLVPQIGIPTLLAAFRHFDFQPIDGDGNEDGFVLLFVPLDSPIQSLNHLTDTLATVQEALTAVKSIATFASILAGVDSLVKGLTVSPYFVFMAADEIGSLNDHTAIQRRWWQNDIELEDGISSMLLLSANPTMKLDVYNARFKTEDGVYGPDDSQGHMVVSIPDYITAIHNLKAAKPRSHPPDAVEVPRLPNDDKGFNETISSLRWMWA